MSLSIPLTIGIIADGMIFGFALEKGHVYRPEVIVGQMTLTDFTMMKMFMSAVATSALIHAALHILPTTRAKIDNARGVGKPSTGANLTGTAFGAAMLGAGMAVAGACPGTVVAQFGAGEFYAFPTLLAGVGGALVYGYFIRDSFPTACGVKRTPGLRDPPKHLDTALDVDYSVAAVGLAGVLAAAVYAIDYLFPYTADAAAVAVPMLEQVQWNPIYSGMLVGFSQLPLLLIYGRAIGSSSTYANIAAELVHAFDGPSDYWKDIKANKGRWWQAYLLTGAALGALASTYFSGSHEMWIPAANDPPLWMSVIGGTLIVAGARTACGCTSGHGISGFSQLGINSIVAVPSMFAGGILTGVLLKSMGIYPAYMNV